MQSLAYLAASCFAVALLAVPSGHAQKEIANPRSIASAKTVYFEDKSGVDAVGKKALGELHHWARFQIVDDPKQADLFIVLSSDPYRGGNLVFAGGQTGTIDSQGHVEEDPVPNFNKLSPTRYAFLTVIDGRTGQNLWSSSQRWGGLLTGFDSVGEHLVQEFEKHATAAEKSASLKVIKDFDPAYPSEASNKHIEGTVIVRIVVDKNGNVSDAKAISGPPELYQSSMDAAKQYKFEPPEEAPVTTRVEMTYALGPKPCPPGKKADSAQVFYGGRFPRKAAHPGELRILAALSDPSPPYPEQAREKGIEGNLELFITVAPSGDVVGVRVVKSVDPAIDEAAEATVRTWKFKVTRGQQAGFPIKFHYQLSCW